MEYYREAIGDPAWRILIGETPQGGYAMRTPPELSALTHEGDMEIRRIYLLAGWQRSGHGGALMSYVVQQGEGLR